MKSLFVACVILITTSVLVSIIDAEEIRTEKDSIDVYEFPVRPGMDEWKNFKTNAEQLEACQIPEDILARMTTEGLVNTCLNYPKAYDFMAYSDFLTGIDKVISRFNGLVELMKRPRAASILLEEYIVADPDNMVSKTPLVGKEPRYPRFRLMFIELLLGHEKILVRLNKEEKKVLIKECLIKYEIKQNHPSFGLMHFKTIGMLVGKILLSEDYKEFKAKYNKDKMYKLFLEDKIPTDRKILYEIMHSARRYIEENRRGKN